MVLSRKDELRMMFKLMVAWAQYLRTMDDAHLKAVQEYNTYMETVMKGYKNA